MNTLQRIALALTIIGALNWGLIGFFRFDLVASLFGGQESFLSRAIYSLVGISGLICLSLLFKTWDDPVEYRTRKNQGNLNYGTEFGEEADFSSLKNKKEE